MKGKYINTKIMLACLSKKQHSPKDIHVQLQETIAEHRKIMKLLHAISLQNNNLSNMQKRKAA